MSSMHRATAFEPPPLHDALAAVDERTRGLIERRRSRPGSGRRGWGLRRFLFVADGVGLAGAFLLTLAVTGLELAPPLLAAFAIGASAWLVAANAWGLYDSDVARADHSTTDDLVRVFHLATLGAWLGAVGAYMVTSPAGVAWVGVLWALALVTLPATRTAARGMCRRRDAYLQNTIVLGAGDVGQLVARKLVKHPEYGLNLVALVDPAPRERRPELAHVAVVEQLDSLPRLIELLDVERVIVAFSSDSERTLLELVRPLQQLGVHVDLVPRLFELLGPEATVHSVEGLPLIGLPSARPARPSRLLKRAVDVALAAVAAVALAPLLAYIALRIRRDSPGPVLFRQTRVGEGMRPFTVLKFRTMYVGTPEDEHRRYIERTMTAGADAERNGLYKLDRTFAVTPFGRWLRKTSLDELPQLFNVLRGEMSLVGPRPCLPYETANFRTHHFERFRVRPGITGLWQVTARASATFGEALEMDVAYVRSWSLGLDLRLLARTPLSIVRQRGATA